MSYKIEVEQDKDGFEDYKSDEFVVDMPIILKAIKAAIKNKHTPQIGAIIIANNYYYIVSVVYYEDSVRYYVSDENKSVLDKH